MFITKNKNIFLSLAVIVILGSISCITFLGLPLSIELVGGSAVEMSFNKENEIPSIEKVQDIFESNNISSVSVRAIGDNGYVVKSESFSEENQKGIISEINTLGGTITKLSSIGPSLGYELRNKAILAFIVVAVLIMLYIAYTFRKVSKPVSSWSYGLITLATLVHDVLVPSAVFAILSRFYGFEVDSLFITALLVIMGYSINDTIVVFDRVRENLAKVEDEEKRIRDFETIVGDSLNQTFVRSFNTSFTTFLALLSLAFFAGEAVRPFVLTLIAGVVAGTYSSILFATPSLIWFKDRANLKASK